MYDIKKSITKIQTDYQQGTCDHIKNRGSTLDNVIPYSVMFIAKKLERKVSIMATYSKKQQKFYAGFVCNWKIHRTCSFKLRESVKISGKYWVEQVHGTFTMKINGFDTIYIKNKIK